MQRAQRKRLKAGGKTWKEIGRTVCLIHSDGPWLVALYRCVYQNSCQNRLGVKWNNLFHKEKPFRPFLCYYLRLKMPTSFDKTAAISASMLLSLAFFRATWRFSYLYLPSFCPSRKLTGEAIPGILARWMSEVSELKSEQISYHARSTRVLHPPLYPVFSIFFAIFSLYLQKSLQNCGTTFLKQLNLTTPVPGQTKLHIPSSTTALRFALEKSRSVCRRLKMDFSNTSVIPVDCHFADCCRYWRLVFCQTVYF